MMTVSGLAIAVSSPVLGAIADAGGRRKPWLAVFTWIAVAGCLLLWFAEPAPRFVLYTLVVVGVANLTFELAGVYYNAMLPEIVGPSHLGRLSGWAWGLGYAGGLACLVLALLAFVQAEPPLLGLDKESAEHVRITGPSGRHLAVSLQPAAAFLDSGSRERGAAGGRGGPARARSAARHLHPSGPLS